MLEHVMTIVGIFILVVTIFVHGVRLRDLEEEVADLGLQVVANREELLQEIIDAEDRAKHYAIEERTGN